MNDTFSKVYALNYRFCTHMMIKLFNEILFVAPKYEIIMVLTNYIAIAMLDISQLSLVKLLLFIFFAIIYLLLSSTSLFIIIALSTIALALVSARKGDSDKFFFI